MFMVIGSEGFALDTKSASPSEYYLCLSTLSWSKFCNFGLMTCHDATMIVHMQKSFLQVLTGDCELSVTNMMS